MNSAAEVRKRMNFTDKRSRDGKRKSGPPLSLDWRSAVWLWPYLIGMGAISYFSSFDTRTPSSVPLLGLHGPGNELTFGWDILAVALLSLVIYAFAIRSRLPAEQALDYIGDPTLEEAEGVDARA